MNASPFAAAGASLVASLVATPVVRAMARRIGMVAQPKADRWHQRPTAMLGGIAIFIAALVGLGVSGFARHAVVTLVASGFLFAIGLIDDFVHLKPYQKLVAQIAAAIYVINFGLILPWTGVPALNIAVTIFWLVGITNAVNMLDNMDALAGGVAAIASFFLAIVCMQNGQAIESTIALVFAAAIAGFLVYNFNPASIFMGDCGSMFIGFFLASLALASSSGIQAGGRTRSLLAVLAVPVLILFIPIFDTTFVTLMRKLFGRRATQGGRDHTSHRLVALGVSERRAVLLLWMLSAVSGSIAVLLRRVTIDLSLTLIAAFAIAMTIVGLYLAGVTVYTREEAQRAERKPIVAFLIDLSYKRRIFEVLLDVVLTIAAYAIAYRLRFGAPNAGPDWQMFRDTLPLIIGTKITVFLAAGMYRGLWRYVSFDDALLFVKAVVASSIAAMLVLLFTSRFAGLSRVVFVVDGVVLLLFVGITRTSFRALRALLRPLGRRGADSGVPVLIFGAGDAAELLFREIRNNPAHARQVVAFFDDDVRKAGKMLHGLPVLGGGTTLRDAIAKCSAGEVIVSTNSVAPERLEEIVSTCAASGVSLRRLSIAIVPLADDVRR